MFPSQSTPLLKQRIRLHMQSTLFARAHLSELFYLRFDLMHLNLDQQTDRLVLELWRRVFLLYLHLITSMDRLFSQYLYG
jgi:hypothetical protein